MMYLAQNIHKVMKRAAQRRDLYLFKMNEASYSTEDWHAINNSVSLRF